MKRFWLLIAVLSVFIVSGGCSTETVKKQNKQDISSDNGKNSSDTIEPTSNSETEEVADDNLTDEYFMENFSIYRNPIDKYYLPKIYAMDVSQAEIRAAQDSYKKVWECEFKNLIKWLRKKCIYSEDKKNIRALEKNVAAQIKIEKKVYTTELIDAYKVNPDPSKAKDTVSRNICWGTGTRSRLNQSIGEIYRDASMRIINLYGGEKEYKFLKIDYSKIIAE